MYQLWSDRTRSWTGHGGKNHLHHLEWSSRGKWFEQKHQSLINKRTHFRNVSVDSQSQWLKRCSHVGNRFATTSSRGSFIRLIYCEKQVKLEPHMFRRATPHVAHLGRPSLDIAGPIEAWLMQCSHTRGRCTGGGRGGRESRRCCVPVKPWLLGGMWKGLCCMANWWSLVSWGEMAAEEDCERERGEEEGGGREPEGTGRREGGGGGENKHMLVNTETPTRKNTSHISQCGCWHPVTCHWSLRSLMPLSDQRNALTAPEGYGPPAGIFLKCRQVYVIMFRCKATMTQTSFFFC